VDDDGSGRVQSSLQGSPINAEPALAVGLNDDEPLIRGHSAWALAQVGTPEAVQAPSSRVESCDPTLISLSDKYF
jgi:hypothetical protein